MIQSKSKRRRTGSPSDRGPQADVPALGERILSPSPFCSSGLPTGGTLQPSHGCQVLALPGPFRNVSAGHPGCPASSNSTRKMSHHRPTAFPTLTFCFFVILARDLSILLIFQRIRFLFSLIFSIALFPMSLICFWLCYFLLVWLLVSRKLVVVARWQAACRGPSRGQEEGTGERGAGALPGDGGWISSD